MSDNHYWDDFEIHDGNFDQQKSEPESRLSKRSNSGISDFDNDSFRISEIEPINPLAITTDATISTTAAVKSNNKNSSLYRFSELSTIKDEVVKPSPSQFTTTTTTTTTSSNIKKYENSTSFKNNIDSSTTNSFKIPDIPKSSSSIPISTKVPLSIEQQQALVMPSIAKSKNDEIEIDDTKRFKVRPPLAQHRASISRRPRDPQANINGGGSVAVGGGSQSRLSRLPPNDNLINLKNSQFEELVKAVKIIDEQKFKISGFIAEIKDLKMQNHQKDKSVQQMQKESSNVPHVVHSLSEEIRVLRTERRTYQEKISLLEKNSHSSIEEVVRLQEIVDKLEKLVKTKKLDDAEKLNEKVVHLLKQMETYEVQVTEWQKRAKYLEKEKNIEIREIRNKLSKQVQDNEILQEDIQKMKQKLKERDQQIAVASIYTLSNRKIQLQQQGGGDINDLEHNDRFSIRTTRTKQSKMKEETRSTQVVRQPLKRNTIITSLRTDDNNISKNHASSSTLIVKQPSEVVVNSSKKQIIRGQPESVYNSSTIQQQQTSPLQAPVSLIPSFSRNDRAVEPTTKEYHALQASSVIPFSFNTMFGDEKLNSGTTNSDTYGGTNTRIRGDHIIVNQRGNTLRSNTDRLDEMKTELRNLENSKSLSGIEKKVSLKLEIEQLESQDFSEKSLDSLPDSTKKKEEPIKPPKATSIPSFSSSISSIHQRNYADDFD